MQFQTKDSGKRQEYASGMRRDVQDGKPSLVSWMREVPYTESFIYRIGMLATRGAEKYGRSNFQLADSEEELERFMDSAWRHFHQWVYGETDEDHAAGVVFNLWAAEMVKYKLRERALYEAAANIEWWPGLTGWGECTCDDCTAESAARELGRKLAAADPVDCCDTDDCPECEDDTKTIVFETKHSDLCSGCGTVLGPDELSCSDCVLRYSKSSTASSYDTVEPSTVPGWRKFGHEEDEK